MPTGIAPAAIARARKLRHNVTDGERKLWSELKEFRCLYGFHIRKRVPLGPSKALAVEVDAEHHFLPERMERGSKRDEWFASQGYKVLRFTTADLSDWFDGCMEEVLGALGLRQGAS